MLPESAEPGNPGVGLLKGARVDGIDAAGSIDADVNKTAFAERSEVLRYACLSDAEFAADDIGEAAGALFALRQ